MRTILLAGMMITSVAFAGQNDPQAEVRYQMKYGRSTPAVETRQNTSRNDEVQACHKVAAAGPSSTSDRFTAKYGHSSAGNLKAEPLLVASAPHVACEMECCKHKL